MAANPPTVCDQITGLLFTEAVTQQQLQQQLVLELQKGYPNPSVIRTLQDALLVQSGKVSAHQTDRDLACSAGC